MNIFRRLFGGEGRRADSGIYLYVQCNSCEEIVRIRLEPQYELVLTDDGGYRSHKTIVGTRCFRPLDAWFHFDGDRQLTGADLDGGTLTTEAAYTAQRAASTRGDKSD